MKTWKLHYAKRDCDRAWREYEAATDDPTVSRDTLRELGEYAEICQAKFSQVYDSLSSVNQPITRDEAERKSRAATCSICTLAHALRVCDECQFQQFPVVLVTDLDVTNIVAQTNRMWASLPEGNLK